jgi:hypothetical protein
MSKDNADPGEANLCPHCGQPNESEAHFCSNCGQPLAPPAGTEAPPPTVLDQPERAGWLLTLISGPDSGTAYPVGEKLVLGRDTGCDLVLNDPKVSRRHAVIERLAEGRYRLQDLGSSNGTFLLGQRVETAEITPGAELRIGDTLMSLAPEVESCAQCGAALEPGLEFCGNCGHRVGEPAHFDLDQRIARLRVESGEAPPQEGGFYRPPQPAAESSAPAPARQRVSVGSTGPATSRGLPRWLVFGCLALLLLFAAAACCSLVLPLLADYS